MTCKHDPLIYTQVKPADQGHFNVRIAAKCSKCGAESELHYRFAFDIPDVRLRWTVDCPCGDKRSGVAPNDITCGCGLIHHYQDAA